MSSSFKPRSILLTGGAGFIGSHVTNLLLHHYKDTDIKIVVLDRLDYCARDRNWDSELIKLPNFFFRKGDICDQANNLKLMQEFDIDTIMAFAAQTLVCTSWANSHQFVVDNVLGTNNLLHAAQEWGKIRRIIHVSTDEVYGEVSLDQKQGCKEDSPMNPTNPYAASKAGAEQIAQAYARSYGKTMPIIITRGNNVYGPGQFVDKMIPKFAVMLATNQKVTIHGTGAARRTFVHVHDVAHAFLTILEKGKIGEIYNIGSDNEHSVMDIANMLYEFQQERENLPLKESLPSKAKKENDFFVNVTDRQFNDKRYHICSQKLLELGWKETISFQDGLKSTFEWYHAHTAEYATSVMTFTGFSTPLKEEREEKKEKK